MTPFEREELKRRAEAKLAAMRERAMRLRRRVLTGAAIAFVVLWVAIFAQMITGNDPALEPIAANVRSATGEPTTSDSESRLSSPEHHGEGEESDNEGEAEENETWSEAGRSEAEAAEAEELEAAEQQAEAEAAEAAEAEELETATTGQS